MKDVRARNQGCCFPCIYETLPRLEIIISNKFLYKCERNSERPRSSASRLFYFLFFSKERNRYSTSRIVSTCVHTQEKERSRHNIAFEYNGRLISILYPLPDPYHLWPFQPNGFHTQIRKSSQTTGVLRVFQFSSHLVWIVLRSFFTFTEKLSWRVQQQSEEAENSDPEVDTLFLLVVSRLFSFFEAKIVEYKIFRLQMFLFEIILYYFSATTSKSNYK